MLIPPDLPSYSPQNTFDYYHKIFSHISLILDPNRDFEWKLCAKGSKACITSAHKINIGLGWMERMADHRTGIHQGLSLTCERIAATCAHEIAHAKLGHTQQIEYEHCISLGCLSVGLSGISKITADSMHKSTLTMPYSKKVILAIVMIALIGIALYFWFRHMQGLRDNEHDADIEGMKILKVAGIKPNAMAEMLQTMYQTHKTYYDSINGSNWSFCLTHSHPLPQVRYDYCIKKLPSV